MNIFLEEKEIEEIKPVLESPDKGLVITPEKKGRIEGTEEIPDPIKEIIAMDALTIGARKAAEIHGVGKTTANDYSNGISLPPEAAARVLDKKHGIQDLAISKLLQTLNLIDPTNVDKERDKVTILNGLSQVIDRLSDGGNNKGDRALHLHLHAPQMKKVSDYEAIDV